MKRRVPLERSIVESVLREARRLGWWAMKNHGSAFGVKGLPDVLVIKGGRAAWMEVKRPGEEPTKIQEHRMRELIETGCPVAVVRSAGDAREFLTAIR
jgi:Holliday junction resolvase